MDRLPRAGGFLSAVAGAIVCLAAAGWPAEATAQVFGDTTERISVASDGTEAKRRSTNNPSFGTYRSAISGDGRFVAFVSDSPNLVARDTNGDNPNLLHIGYDIFVHDRQAETTERVSIASDGTEAYYGRCGDPAISADGRFVAFDSSDGDLVDGDTNGDRDVFVHDRQTGTTERVSIASDGSEVVNGDNHSPAISADGRYVAFVSIAAKLVVGDTNHEEDVFVHDRKTGATKRVSVSSDGTGGNYYSHQPAISADGRFVAFVSGSSNLVAHDTNGWEDVFVHDRQTGITERVSIASDGEEANFLPTGEPAISADGRFVTFNSSASNLVAGDTNGRHDVFVHDRQTGTTERISVASDGTQANHDSAFSAISADGRFVAFGSLASNLVSRDGNGWADAFVHDRRTRTTARASVASDGSEGNSESVFQWGGRGLAISADGRSVAFSSSSSNLVAGDTNGVADIFVRSYGSASASPLAPVARADGPYTFCANVGALILDGTGSFNPDEGASEPGFPGDTIQAHEWDLDDDGAFDDAVGAKPDVTGFFDTAPAGKHTVALKVTDTSATAFPSSGLGDLSGVDTAEVTVFAAGEPSCACVTNLAARVKSGKVQLYWTDVGAPGGYRVYRAELPGGQSHAVATVPPGYLYVDDNVVNGRSYGYKLISIAENGGEGCPSNQVIATPRGR